MLFMLYEEKYRLADCVFSVIPPRERGAMNGLIDTEFIYAYRSVVLALHNCASASRI